MDLTTLVDRFFNDLFLLLDLTFSKSLHVVLKLYFRFIVDFVDFLYFAFENINELLQTWFRWQLNVTR